MKRRPLGKTGVQVSMLGIGDVAEQEKLGQTGVAERQRDQRVAVAAL